jgi:glutathione S-transferase
VAKLESALSKPSHYLTGETVTLADLAIAPVAKATLGFFGDHEYVSGKTIET